MMCYLHVCLLQILELLIMSAFHCRGENKINTRIKTCGNGHMKRALL